MNSGRRLLIAEDDANDQQLIKRSLRKLGFEGSVEFAQDGQEAVELLEREGPPTVLMLDIKMPKLTGLEVLERIRRMPAFSVLPVVMLTSSSEPTDVERAYDLGANAFVVKPAAFAEFQEAVERTVSFWMGLNEPPANR